MTDKIDMADSSRLIGKNHEPSAISHELLPISHEPSDVSQAVLVTAIANPFQPYTSRRVTVLPHVPGKGLMEYARDVMKETSPDFTLEAGINGRMIEDGLTTDIAIRPNDSLVFWRRPAGGDQMAKNIGMMVAMVGLMVAAPYAGGPAALGMFQAGMIAPGAVAATAKLITGGIVLTGGLLASAMLAPQKPDVPEARLPDPTYSWDIQANTANEGTPWPVAYGKEQVQPPLIGKYTELLGNKQYLNLLYAVADHSVDLIDNIKINDSDIADFSGTWYEARFGELDQEVLPNFNDTVTDSSVNEKLQKDFETTDTDIVPVDIPDTPSWTTTITTSASNVAHIVIRCEIPGEFWAYAADNYNKTWAQWSIQARYRVNSPPGSWNYKTFNGQARVEYWTDSIGQQHLIGNINIYLELDLSGSPEKYDVGVQILSSEAETGQYINLKGITETTSLPAITKNVSGNAFDELRVYARFPYGLWYADENGSIQASSVKLMAGVKISTGEWTYHAATITGNRNEAVRYCFKFQNLDHGTYQVRLAYVEPPPSTRTAYPDRFQDDCYFDYYQTAIYDDFIYPGASLLAIRALSTDQLHGQIPRVSCRVTRNNVSIYNGSSWVDKAADNPAWIAWDMFGNDQYAWGVDETRMLYADFLAWANWCDDSGDERGDVDSGISTSVGTDYLQDTSKAWETNQMAGWTLRDSASDDFLIESNTNDTLTVNGTPASGAYTIRRHFRANIYFDATRGFQQALALIETLGWGRVVMKGTSVGVIMDKPGTPVQGFGVGNIIANTFEIEYLRVENRANLAEVTYYAAILNGARQTIRVPRQDYTEAASTDVEPVQLDLIGCTYRAPAVYHGQFLMAANQLLKKVVAFEVDVDAIACQAGDLIYVSHDLPQWGYSGRVVSATSGTVVLDREVTMSPGTTYQVMVRHQTDVDADGYDDFELQTIAAVGVETTTDTLTLSGTWTNVPAEDAVYMFGEQYALYEIFRVISVSRAGDLIRRIVALEYDEDIYTPEQELNEDESVSDLTLVDGIAAREFYRWQDPTRRGFAQITWRGMALEWYVFFKNQDEVPSDWVLWGKTNSPLANIYDLEPMTNYRFAVSPSASPAAGEYVNLEFKGYGDGVRPFWSVSGLRIKGDDVGGDAWDTPDLTVEWNPTNRASFGAGDEPAGAGIYPPNWTFDSFRVQVLSGPGGTVLREQITQNIEFTYTLGMNSEDNNGSPDASLMIKVWGRTPDQLESAIASRVFCQNDAPGIPANLGAESKLGGAAFRWDPSAEKDFAHFEIRTKLETDAWSDWSEVQGTSYRRNLLITEMVTHGLRPTVYIEVKSVDVFAQESSAASANIVANSPLDSHFQMWVTLDDGITGTGDEIHDGDIDSGGVTVT